ncbi:MAG: glycosyltransferase family 4 protein [Opitutaceae bacterium]|jgi:glycosyltransferase involved in cell wall biosynthesis
MKITIVSSFFLPVPPVAGGAMEKIWFRLAREFAAAGHEVTHVSRTWPGFPDRETIDGVLMLRVPGTNHHRRLWQNLLSDFFWGLRVARRLPPGDIVACNTVTLPVYLKWLRPRAGCVVAVLGRMPKGHAHFYGLVHRLIATSEAVQAQVVRENPRLADRTLVVPNPIDWTLHQEPLRDPSAPVTIGFVGRMNPEKGLEILLRAAAALARRPGLPSWRLRLVGPQTVAEGGGGEAYVDGLRALAADAGADVAVEPPLYDPVALARVYRSLDIFCYPSLAEKGEGLSVAPLEAMSAGAVPVVSALDCYADVIRHDHNGLVFDHRAPNAPDLLADAFARLIADADLRHHLGARARLDARPFDYAAVAQALLDDFSTLNRPPDYLAKNTPSGK